MALATATLAGLPLAAPERCLADAGIPPASVGPATAQEAQILWTDGQADYSAGRYAEAAAKLERYIARYPGYPGYLDARLLLGRAYLELGKPAAALPELKSYIQVRGKAPSTLEARIDLGRAQLATRHAAEALLTSEETLKIAAPDDSAIRVDALNLKARSLIALKRDRQATAAIDSAWKALPKPSSAALRGKLLNTRLELAFRGCERFPSSGPLDEAQVRDQLGRRGTCLLESLSVFRKLLETGDAASARTGSVRIGQAYQGYLGTCAHPPAPPALKPKDRTARQKEAYFRELRLVLEQECHQKTQQGLDLLKTWSASTPATTSDSLNQAAAELEKLGARPPSH